MLRENHHLHQDAWRQPHLPTCVTQPSAGTIPCLCSANKSQNSHQGQGSAWLGAAVWGAQGSWQAVSRAQASPAPWQQRRWQPCREQEHEPNQWPREGIIPSSQHLLDIIYSFLHPPVQRALNKVELAQGSSIWTVGNTSAESQLQQALLSPRRWWLWGVPELPTGAHQEEAGLAQWGMREQVQVETQEPQCGCKWKHFPWESQALGQAAREGTQPPSEEAFKIQEGIAQIALIHLTGPQTILFWVGDCNRDALSSLPVRVSTLKCVSTNTKPQGFFSGLYMQTGGLTHGFLGCSFLCLNMWHACICTHTAGGEAIPFKAFSHFSVAGTRAGTPCILEGRSKH